MPPECEHNWVKSQEMVQSYIFTTAGYDCNVYEKRIIYRLIQILQAEIDGKHLTADLCIRKSSSDDRVVILRTADFLAPGDRNTTRVEEALWSLRNKHFILDDGEKKRLIGLIERPEFNYRRGWVRFEIQPEVYKALLDFSRGFRKFDIAIALSLRSPYSMRMYELICGQKNPIEFKIDVLKKMFWLEGRYPNNGDFIRRVIVPAKKELDAYSPFSFEFTIRKTGAKITSLVFSPIVYLERCNPILAERNLITRCSISWDLTQAERHTLHNIGFTDRELKNNINTFKEVKQKYNLLEVLADIRIRLSGKENPKGYVINALKGIIRDGR